jgi:hypothetical protein
MAWLWSHLICVFAIMLPLTWIGLVKFIRTTSVRIDRMDKEAVFIKHTGRSTTRSRGYQSALCGSVNRCIEAETSEKRHAIMQGRLQGSVLHHYYFSGDSRQCRRRDTRIPRISCRVGICSQISTSDATIVVGSVDLFQLARSNQSHERTPQQFETRQLEFVHASVPTPRSSKNSTSTWSRSSCRVGAWCRCEERDRER